MVGQDVIVAANYMGDYDTMTPDTLGRHAGFLDGYATNAPGFPNVENAF